MIQHVREKKSDTAAVGLEKYDASLSIFLAAYQGPHCLGTEEYSLKFFFFFFLLVHRM